MADIMEDVNFDPESGGDMSGGGVNNTGTGSPIDYTSTSGVKKDNPFEFMAQMCINNPRPLVIFLVGKMGTGKSSLGNVLLGCSNNREDQVFESKRSATAVTEHARGFMGRLEKHNDRVLLVIDTPGFGDPARTTTDILNEIKILADQADEALKFYEPSFCIIGVLGCHSRVTDEDLNTLRCLYQVFGTAYLNKTCLVFTHADLLDDALTNMSNNMGSNQVSLPPTSPLVGNTAVSSNSLTGNGVSLIDEKLHEYLKGSGEDIMQILNNAAGGLIPINTLDRSDRSSFDKIIQSCMNIAGPFPKPRGKVARRLRQAALKENEYWRKQDMASAESKKKNDGDATRSSGNEEGYGCVLS